MSAFDPKRTLNDQLHKWWSELVPPYGSGVLHLHAQSSSRAWRIGVLETTPINLNAPNINAFRKSLQDLGYVEGQNLIIAYRSAEGRGELFTELTTELLDLNVHVILTRGLLSVSIDRLQAERLKRPIAK